MSSKDRLKRLKKDKSKSGQTIYSKRRVREFLRIQELRNKRNQSAKNQKK